MIFESQKYQKGTKDVVEFQLFTFVLFVPFVVELKMFSSMIEDLTVASSYFYELANRCII